MYFLRTCLSNNPQAIIPLRTVNSILFCILALAAASCSEVENLILGEDDREPISFSMSDEGVRATRAGFRGGPTFIAMRMQSNSKKDGATKLYTKTTATAEVDNTKNDESYSSVTFTEDERCYWDDAHGQYSKLSVFAVAIPNMATDVMGLNGLLADGGSSTLTGKWGTNDTNTIEWTVSTTQTKDNTDDNAAPVTEESGTIDKEDLVYSNNIREGGEDGVYRWSFKNSQYEPNPTGELGAHENGPMMFLTPDDKDNPLDTPSSMQGKFDKGHLIFKHALSRITVTLESGEGFEAAPFTLADPGVQFLQMYVHGTLNLPKGQWTLDTAHPATVNTKPARQTEDTPVTRVFYKTVAQMLPGYSFVDGSGTKVMQFTIDGNTYYITQDMLYDALYKIEDNRYAKYGYTAGKFTMMQGKNYQFKFLVNKRKVEAITASLVPWENVTAVEKNLTNARIKLQLEERGTAQTTNVAFYKAKDNKTSAGIDDGYTTWNWKTGYTNLGASWDSKNNHWTTSHFWETSKDFYHFRALMPAATVKSTDTTPDPDEDYATLTSAASYTDVCWGAPMLDDGDNEDQGTFKWLYGPTSGGFDHADDGTTVATGLPAGTEHQIYKAIGATEDPVKLTLFHVMSELNFTLNTTNDADKVYFGDGTDAAHSTKIELVGYKASGKVLLGNGLVTATGDAATSTVSTSLSASNLTCKYGAVPQDLTAVKLYITTPDGNQYIIDLKDVKATTVSSANLANPYDKVGGTGADKDYYKITRWYPGFKYTYTFTLKKTGITNLQATVVDWETVTAADETVTIK